jgi:hypothetical protein
LEALVCSKLAQQISPFHLELLKILLQHRDLALNKLTPLQQYLLLVLAVPNLLQVLQRLDLVPPKLAQLLHRLDLVQHKQIPLHLLSDSVELILVELHHSALGSHRQATLDSVLALEPLLSHRRPDFSLEQVIFFYGMTWNELFDYFSVLGFGSFGTSLGGTGITTPASSSFSLGTTFGSTAPTTGLFGQQQQQTFAPAQQAGTAVESVLSSVLYCNIYGDERDAILARWNLLQAAWGTGKGLTSP